MPRRPTKKCKQEPEIAVIDPTHLTKAGLVVLQRYLDHGQRLPTVSSKTSYKDISRHTKKFSAARRTMATLATKILLPARQAGETYHNELFDIPNEQLHAFTAGQSRVLDDLLDECEEVVKLCIELQVEAEGDLGRLQAEVTRVKVATNSKERRELLLELTRAVPIMACIKDVFNHLTESLKAIQTELSGSEERSDETIRRILKGWEGVSASGLQLLA